MAKQFISDIDHSKRTWGETREPGWPEDGNERTKLGCLQRIATATEAMAQNHIKLQDDYKYMRESRDRWREKAEKAERRITALKGVITKMKRRKS